MSASFCSPTTSISPRSYKVAVWTNGRKPPPACCLQTLAYGADSWKFRRRQITPDPHPTLFRRHACTNVHRAVDRLAASGISTVLDVRRVVSGAPPPFRDHPDSG